MVEIGTDDLRATVDESHPHFQTAIENRAEALGVDASEVTAPLISFSYGGDLYYFAPTAVSYGGRWYLASMTSMLSGTLGIDGIGISKLPT